MTALAADEHEAAPLPAPLLRLPAISFRAGKPDAGERAVPEETAVALSYDGATQAVMMATPADLRDFAIGFSLTEGIVEGPGEIKSLEVLPTSDGVELQMWLKTPRGEALAARRRFLAGPTGCGLCGVDSLAAAMRAPLKVGGALRVTPAAIAAAAGSLRDAQPLFRDTRAVHAAGLWRSGSGLILAREDVGRHNALDKLIGAAALARISAADGVLVLTSRVSVEMVQKAAVLGTPILVAVSAPTALAVRMAEAAEITLVGVARDDGFEVFTHPQRIEAGAALDADATG